jgi:hypothetical protein
MKRLYFWACVLILLITVTGNTNAAITSLVGDKDGFGVSGAPAVPANGLGFVSDLGGTFFTDYRSASDLTNAPFTDIWDAPGSFSYTQSYILGGLTPTSAALDIQIAGIHDINQATAYNLYYNGTSVGVIPSNPDSNNFEEVKLYSFVIPLNLLSGSDQVSLSGTGGDGYIINFSELTIQTNAVPEPSTMLLLSFGLFGLAGFRRSFKR